MLPGVAVGDGCAIGVLIVMVTLRLMGVNPAGYKMVFGAELGDKMVFGAELGVAIGEAEACSTTVPGTGAVM